MFGDWYEKRGSLQVWFCSKNSVHIVNFHVPRTEEVRMEREVVLERQAGQRTFAHLLLFSGEFDEAFYGAVRLGRSWLCD